MDGYNKQCRQLNQLLLMGARVNGPIVLVEERPLRLWVLNPGRAIPKALKMVIAVPLLGLALKG